MATNPICTVRLRPIIVAYLKDLGNLGAYGKGKAGVMRRFIENGIADALEKRVISPKNAADFGESAEDEDEDS